MSMDHLLQFVVYADSKLNAASSVLVDVETNHIFCEELSDLVEIGSGNFALLEYI